MTPQSPQPDVCIFPQTARDPQRRGDFSDAVVAGVPRAGLELARRTDRVGRAKGTHELPLKVARRGAPLSGRPAS